MTARKRSGRNGRAAPGRPNRNDDRKLRESQTMQTMSPTRCKSVYWSMRRDGRSDHSHACQAPQMKQARQRWELVAPEYQHSGSRDRGQRAVRSLLSDVQAHAICLDNAVLNLAHGDLHRGSCMFHLRHIASRWASTGLRRTAAIPCMSRVPANIACRRCVNSGSDTHSEVSGDAVPLP